MGPSDPGASDAAPRGLPVDDPAQSERFKQAARELGCDESEERFDAVLKAVAKTPAGRDAFKDGGKQGEAEVKVAWLRVSRERWRVGGRRRAKAASSTRVRSRHEAQVLKRAVA